jgi:hypothetical protein
MVGTRTGGAHRGTTGQRNFYGGASPVRPGVQAEVNGAKTKPEGTDDHTYRAENR